MSDAIFPMYTESSSPDRGSTFTGNEFAEFLRMHDVRHIKIATGSPQANGQAERINRTLTPMLAKLASITITPSHGINFYTI